MGVMREFLKGIGPLRRSVRRSKRFTKALGYRLHRVVNVFDPQRRTECTRNTTRCGDDIHSAHYGYWYLGENTPVCCTSNLVGVFFWLVDILDANEIPYFILWGTHLGAVRHKGLIPWDFDIDIGIEATHERKLMDLIGERGQEKGYHIVRDDDYVIRIAYSRMNRQHVDIELWYDDDMADGSLFTHTFYGRISIPRSEVYPLAAYTFHGRTVTGPKEDTYLRKIFGDTIYTHGYRSSDLTDDSEFPLNNPEPARIRESDLTSP
ncbi:MAG: LicD family protein [Candidatus Eisenbacteria bacterium]